MENKDIVKEYSNGELTVVWNLKKCIHAGVCVKTLPQVYNPKEKPWIKIDNAPTADLQAQISQCPSGALSYYMNSELKKETKNMETKVDVVHNGPLLVHGTLTVTDKDGNTEKKDQTTAFCRCGSSNTKPYCDGTHHKVEFKG